MSLTFLKTAREGADLRWQTGHYTTWVLPSEMTCHLHILVMSVELTTGVDRYILTASAQFSQTGTELNIMEPYYEDMCGSHLNDLDIFLDWHLKMWSVCYTLAHLLFCTFHKALAFITYLICVKNTNSLFAAYYYSHINMYERWSSSQLLY